MRRVRKSERFRSGWLSILASLVLASPALLANPTQPVVLAGQAQFITPDASTLNVVTSTDKAIIQWGSFNIGSMEKTLFHQPSSSSAVLNKVLSGNPSVLQGLLGSNGRVLLLNPSGVLVTRDAVINTSSFIASTLDLHNEDFLRGSDLLFKGDSTATIINYGTVESWGGDVLLIGYQVENHGSLKAPKGTVGLAAAQEVLLKPTSSELLYIKPNTSTPPAHIGVLQAGTIQAVQAELKADGNPYALAIKQSGKVDATGVEKRNGRVFLVAKSGTVKNTGALNAKTITGDGKKIGGEVQVTGHKITLDEHASVNVAGESGGTVLIGGDYQGKNPDVPNAAITYVGPDVVIDANAHGTGDGGKVILWGDEATGFYGHISARGGSKGDGGFVEVSGKYLEYRGLADTRAPYGKAGMLLLDPTDMTVTLAPTTAAFSAGTYSGTGNTSNINNVDLVTQLGLSSVTITTVSPFAGNGDITFSAPVNYNSANSLTLFAERDIVLQDLLANGPLLGDLFATAGRDLHMVSGSATAYRSDQTFTIAGDVNMDNISDIQSIVGNVTIDATNVNMNGVTTITTSGPGNVVINVSQNFFADVGAIAGVNSAGSTTITAGNNITNNGIIQSNSGNVNATAANTFTINGSVTSGTGDLNLTGTTAFLLNPGAILSTLGGDINIRGGIVTLLADVSTATNAGAVSIISTVSTEVGTGINVATDTGNLTINAGPLYTQDSGSNVQSNSGHMVITATDINVAATANIQTAAGDLDITAAHDLTTGTGSTIQSTGAGDVNISVGNDMNANGAVTATGAGDVNINVGHDLFAVSLSTNTSDLNITVGHDFNLTNFLGFVSTVSGDMNISVGNNMTIGPLNFVFTDSGDLVAHIGGNLSMNNSLLQTTSGDLTVEVGRDFSLAGTANYNTTSGIFTTEVGRDLTTEAGVTIANAGPNPTHITVGRDVISAGVIQNTGSGPLDLTVGHDLNLTGNLTTNTGALEVHVGNDILFSNIGPVLARSFGTTAGPMTVTAGRDITTNALPGFQAFFGVPSGGLQTNTNPLFILSGRTTTIGPHTLLQWGPGHTTIVVDNEHPLRPAFGPGAFNLDPTALFSTLGPVQIYTSIRNLNHIGAPINGVVFVPGPPLEDTPTEQWDVYFPERLGLDGIPFTFYYKTGVPVPVTFISALMPNYLYHFLTYQNFYTYYDAPLNGEEG